MPENTQSTGDRNPDLDTVQDCLFAFATLPWDLPAAGLRVKEIDRGNQRLRLMELSKEFVETDWCRSGHVGFVIEGTLEIDFNGSIVRFSRGDGLVIPQGERFQHKALGPEQRVILFLVEPLSRD